MIYPNHKRSFEDLDDDFDEEDSDDPVPVQTQSLSDDEMEYVPQKAPTTSPAEISNSTEAPRQKKRKKLKRVDGTFAVDDLDDDSVGLQLVCLVLFALLFTILVVVLTTDFRFDRSSFRSCRKADNRIRDGG